MRTEITTWSQHGLVLLTNGSYYLKIPQVQRLLGASSSSLPSLSGHLSIFFTRWEHPLATREAVYCPEAWLLPE